jgi:hypothetical protein
MEGNTLMDENIVARKLVEKFVDIVSTLDISKINQKEYREIVAAIYWEIFIKEDKDDN